MKVGMTVAGIHPWATTEMTAQLGEAAGVDSLWAGDHLLGIFHPDLWPDMAYGSLLADPDAWYDPFVIGGALSRGSGVTFGTCVTDGVRREAIDVVRSALTLHHLNPGGFILGVGSGEACSLTPFGYPFDQPVGVLERFLKEVRVLLDTGRMPDGVGRTGIPRESDAGPLPVWLAGHGPRMLRLTGQYADGWLPGWPMSAEQYRARRETVDRIAAEHGRPAPIAALTLLCVLGESRDALRDQFETEPLSKLIGLYADAAVWERHGHEHPFGRRCRGFVDVVIHEHAADDLRALAPRIPIDIVEEVLYLGSPNEIVARATPYADAGLQYAVIANLTGIVGGAAEVERHLPGVAGLVASLHDMPR